MESPVAVGGGRSCRSATRRRRSGARRIRAAGVKRLAERVAAFEGRRCACAGPLLRQVHLRRPTPRVWEARSMLEPASWVRRPHARHKVVWAHGERHDRGRGSPLEGCSSARREGRQAVAVAPARVQDHVQPLEEENLISSFPVVRAFVLVLRRGSHTMIRSTARRRSQWQDRGRPRGRASRPGSVVRRCTSASRGPLRLRARRAELAGMCVALTTRSRRGRAMATTIARRRSTDAGERDGDSVGGRVRQCPGRSGSRCRRPTAHNDGVSDI